MGRLTNMGRDMQVPAGASHARRKNQITRPGRHVELNLGLVWEAGGVIAAVATNHRKRPAGAGVHLQHRVEITATSADRGDATHGRHEVEPYPFANREPADTRRVALRSCTSGA